MPKKYTIQDVILEAWRNPKLRKALIRDATSALKDLGVDVPKGMKIEMHENTKDVRHLVLPMPPVARTQMSRKKVEKKMNRVFGTEDDGPTTFGGASTCT